MKEKNQVNVIIPVHELNPATEELFKKALKSIESQQVKPDKCLIVHTPQTKTKIEEVLTELKFDKDFYQLVENTTDKTDFCSQINLGVDNCKTNYFSILELDDEYSKIYFKNVKEYIESYPETGIFLPIIVEIDNDNKFQAFTNESIWATGFSEKVGYLDINTLLKYPNFSTSGAVFKKSEFVENGKFKTNIKLSFMYELLLRIANADVPIITIPKLGYLHKNGRPGSLFDTYKKELTPKLASFYIGLSRSEYFFENQREIIEPTN